MSSLLEVKKEPVICPFVVVVDSREQAPYSFTGFRTDSRQRNAPLAIETTVAALSTGDYSIVGYEDRVAVERKSLADLYSTLGYGRQRFTRELERLNEMDVAHVVIEASWAEVLGKPPPRSRLRPKTVFRSVNAWQQRYPRVHWDFMGPRVLAEHKTFRVLERYYNEVKDEESD